MTLKASAIMKRRQPFTCSKQPEEPKTKTEGSTTTNPTANTRRLLCRGI